MNKLKKLFFWISLPVLLFTAISPIYAANNRFSDELENSVSDISSHLTPPAQQVGEGGGATISNAVIGLLDDVAIPVAIAIGIIFGVFGAYKMLFSSDEKEVSNGIKIVIMGVIGIIIIMSAKYLGKSVVEVFKNGDIYGSNDLNGMQIATEIYQKIAYPFIKIVLYLALFVIFVILLGKSIKLFTKTDGSSQKASITMIGWSAVSILIIIGAKALVEAIYGKQSEVLDASAMNLGEIGTGILANKDIPLIYTILNRVVGIVSLVVFILFLVQGFRILLNPSKAENFQKLGKNILYTVIGLLVIGAVYLLTNVLVVN